MGDDRREKNLDEGVAKCRYAIAILSEHTASSRCALEELSIIEKKHNEGEITVFPVFYELSPRDLPSTLHWVRKLIFKEVDRHSGTRMICNHAVCKITGDLLNSYNIKSIQDVVRSKSSSLPQAAQLIFQSYQFVDFANLNSRITLLYAAFLVVSNARVMETSSTLNMVSKVFERLFSETSLNLEIDYRELWLLENCICILVNHYMDS